VLSYKNKEDIMAVSSIGPSGLDPFTPVQDTSAEETREPVQEIQTSQTPPLSEGSGTLVDTSA
jgi:hypothetical protein